MSSTPSSSPHPDQQHTTAEPHKSTQHRFFNRKGIRNSGFFGSSSFLSTGASNAGPGGGGAGGSSGGGAAASTPHGPSTSELNGILDYNGLGLGLYSSAAAARSMSSSLKSSNLSTAAMSERPDGDSAWDERERGPELSETIHVKGEMTSQKYLGGHQHWQSFSHGSLNWDALLTSSTFIEPGSGTLAFARLAQNDDVVKPKRVLDIGCGTTSQWATTMASQPEWEQTLFIGLDIAPDGMATDHLPPDVSARLSYMQHDILQPLPFEDDQFDFVRISLVGLSLPEQHWLPLLDEAVRVLMPGCPIEVTEADFVVARERPAATDNDAQAVVDECFDTVLENRFINPRTIGIVPSHLAIAATRLRTSGKMTLAFPTRAPAASGQQAVQSRSADPHATVLQTQLKPTHSPLHAYSAGVVSSHQQDWSSSNSHLLATLYPSMSRVLLQAYADKFDSCSGLLARELATKRLQRQARSHPSTPLVNGTSSSTRVGHTSTAIAIRRDLLEFEIQESLKEWTTELRSRAGLGLLLEREFGWVCEMDRQVEKTLEKVVPVYENALREMKEERSMGSRGGEEFELDPEWEARKSQINVSKREAESELKAVRMRRRGWQTESASAHGIGVFETCTFVALAPVK
ncbi:hypothetical protein ACM66B_001340 [Microbotryomycetes sp. NB124-2]